MRAVEILRQFRKNLRGVHLTRCRAVFAVAHALVGSGRLSLTNLGRAVATRTSAKHGIKRVDRLLGNPRLHADRETFFRAIARRVLVSASRPVIIVDWTAVTPKLWALVAAVAFEGRAIVVYAETHPIARYMKPHVHEEFLLKLKRVLPAGCKPVVVTDAGFRSPWMKEVLHLGWDYIGRIRHGTVQHIKGKVWMGFGKLWRMTRTIPTDLGRFELAREARHPCRLVGIRKLNGLVLPTSPKARGYRLDRGVARQRRNALEPWTLATSLEGPASEVIACYRQRMQIEETFRDTKSHRYGISLAHARTSSPERADVLLLLAAIAMLVTTLVGIAAEFLHLHRTFQANTVRNRRVLSLPTLGRLLASSRARNLRIPWRTSWLRLTAALPLAAPA
jgi:hypothetical protein